MLTLSSASSSAVWSGIPDASSSSSDEFLSPGDNAPFCLMPLDSRYYSGGLVEMIMRCFNDSGEGNCTKELDSG